MLTVIPRRPYRRHADVVVSRCSDLLVRVTLLGRRTRALLSDGKRKDLRRLRLTVLRVENWIARLHAWDVDGVDREFAEFVRA